MKRGICLMSGGVDSFVAAYLACQEWRATIYPLYLKRGASAQIHEQAALTKSLKWLRTQFPHQIKPLKTVTATFPPPELKRKYPKKVLLQNGYVGREFYFASIATHYALTFPKGTIRFIATGSLSEDLYSHNGPAYWKQVNRLLSCEVGKRAAPIIHPLQWGTTLAPADKKRVIGFARKVGIPIEITRSCVASSKKPCGRCLECSQRNGAEKQALCVG